MGEAEETEETEETGETEDEEQRQTTDAPSTGAIIGGILGTLAVIAITVGVVHYVRKHHHDDGPPKHKPPPPVKTGSSTEMLNKPSEPPSVTETCPLSPGEVYYETSGKEPVTNLDDDGSGGALNGGAKYDNMNDDLHDYDPTNHGAGTVHIARGESFVSPAMYV